VSARDRLKAACTVGNIWGEPADLDELINDTIAEALTDPAFHHELTAILRRNASTTQDAPVVRVEAGELRHVEVHPGDLFVLTSPQNLSEEQAHQLREQWRTHVGEGAPLVILERSELSVFRPATTGEQQ